MDEFGKSPLIAITVLMTSAALVAVGAVMQPPSAVPLASSPQPPPQISLVLPAPMPRPVLPEAPPQVARLTPGPELPSSRVAPAELPARLLKPLPPGPYAPAPSVTIPGPPSDPDRPAAPGATSAPSVRALAAASAAARAPSLQGATPPPRPAGKPLVPSPDYAPGPYTPRLALRLPPPPGGQGLGVAPPEAAAKIMASLPRPAHPPPPSLRSALPPPRPGGKPALPTRMLSPGPEAPSPHMLLAAPPAHDDAAPPRPAAVLALALPDALQIAPARLPSLHGATPPPHSGGMPATSSGAPAAGPYVPVLSLTIPSPPIAFHRLNAPSDPHAEFVRPPFAPARSTALTALDHGSPPPRPADKPEHEQRQAVLNENPAGDRSGAAASLPLGVPAPALNGHRPETLDGQVPPWRRYAALVPPDNGAPMVAIILDDLGLNHRRMARAVALPAPLTLAILPYATQLDHWAAQARAAGHELMLHLPMEPTAETEYPGPNALLAHLEVGEIERRIAWNLARFEGYVGVNNHMGSRFTADERLMRLLMARLRERGLLFVDSLTTNASVGGPLARSFGVPTASRDIFLDNEIDLAHIRAQLSKVEHCARRKGHCIAIGHPYRETLEALESWLPALDAKGLQLVPVSAIIARRMTG